MSQTIQEKERTQRLQLVVQFARNVHAARERIERNKKTIAQATADNESAKIALDAGVSELHTQCAKLGIAPTRYAEHLTDAMVGLLVELPMGSQLAGSTGVSGIAKDAFGNTVVIAGGGGVGVGIGGSAPVYGTTGN